MIRDMGRGKWLCILAAGLLSQGVLAADFNFTGSSSPSASNSFTSGGITVTVTTPSGNVSQTSSGVGVKDGILDPGYGLAYGQSLTLSFNQAVNVGGIGFGNWDYATLLHDKAEVAYGGTSEIFQNTTAFDLFCNGTQHTDCYALNNGLGSGPVTSLTVTAVGSALLQNFYVKELCNVTPVPLPGAVWLFGSGLLGLGLVRRRRQA